MGEELFFGAIACLALGLLVAAPICIVVLFVRVRDMRSEMRRLGDQISALTKLRAPEAPPQKAEPAPPPKPAPTAPKPVEPEARPAVPEPPKLYEPKPRTEPTPAPTPPSTKGEPVRKKVVVPTEPSWRERMRKVDWERWIGVRGAAVVGGVLLALAAIFLFRHAFAKGWITPQMRVVMGIATGIGCIVGGWRLRGKSYAFAPHALEGAGIVALYATVYAADKRYHMISLVASFPLMAIVTALACVIAVRNRSILTAVLGLVGGFATPLLLSTGSDRPFSLFGYILLLDLGLFFVGRKRSWPSITFLALLGTFLIESLWIFGRMGEERVALGVGIVGVFAALFAFAGRWLPEDQRRRWLPAQAGGVIFPFVFAVYFSNQLEFRGHVWPNALLLGLLAAAGSYLGRAQLLPWLATGSATAGVAVVAVWFFQVDVDVAVSWELSAVGAGLALIPHGFAEWGHRRGEAFYMASALVSATAWAVLLVLACPAGEEATVYAPLAGLLFVSALLVRQAFLFDKGVFVTVGATAVGAGMGLHYLARDSGVGPDPRIAALLAAALSAPFFLLARRPAGQARFAAYGVAGVIAPFLLALPFRGVDAALEPWFLPTAALVLGVIVAAAGLFAAPAMLFAVGAFLAYLCQGTWVDDLLATPRSSEALTVAFALAVLSAAVFGTWPVIWWKRLSSASGLFVLAPVAALLWYGRVVPLYGERFGDALELGPWFLLALFPAGCVARILTVDREGGIERHGERMILYGLVAAGLVSAGIANQLEHERWAVGAALFAVGAAALWRWLRQDGAAWVAVLAGFVATAILCLHGLSPGHYLRSDARLFNALGYVHLVPALCLVGMAYLLRGAQPGAGAKPWQRVFFAAAPGLGVILVLFAWINLGILNFYSEERSLRFDAERLPARDLTTSLAWGVYAIVLLGLGTAKHVMALRWASLSLFFLSIGKVFLYDLGHLEGLYRVGSLAGLAVSLLGVSLFYQRFVFRGSTRTPAGETS